MTTYDDNVRDFKQKHDKRSDQPLSERLRLPAEWQTDIQERANRMPPPETVIGPLQTGCWGIIAAAPGVGKSMFAAMLAKAISGEYWGKACHWKAPKRRRTLLIDAEMTPHELAMRYDDEPMGEHFALCHLDLLERHDMPAFSLGDDMHQMLLMEAGRYADVIIVDNIEYTLEPAEGHNIWAPETWAQVEPLTRWAKAKNKLLIFIDHLNKEGGVQGSLAKQRGASFVIHLEPEWVEKSKLAFTSHFKKLRYLVNEDELRRDVLWWLEDMGWQAEVRKSTKDLVIELRNEGMSNKQVAKELGVSERTARRISRKNKHLINP